MFTGGGDYSYYYYKIIVKNFRKGKKLVKDIPNSIMVRLLVGILNVHLNYYLQGDFFICFRIEGYEILNLSKPLSQFL